MARLGRGQDKGDGFGQIADDWIAFLEQPQGDARTLGGPFAQAGGGDGAARAAARKQRDGPEFIIFWCGVEILCQCTYFGGGFRGLVDGGVERGELLHAPAPSSSVSPVNSVGTTWAL